MAGVFISYRRSDAEGWAGRLHDALTAHLGAGRFSRIKIFRDIEGIPPGVDFETYINEAVGSADVLIALIGPRWLTASESGRRRLDDPHDLTRAEIATALRRKVTVIPVLVGNATMPESADLPDDLKPLARRQAHELSDSRWAHDCRNLTRVVKPIVVRRGRRAAVMGVALGALVASAVLIVFNQRGIPPSTPAPQPPASAAHLPPGQLSGDWVDNQARYVWQLRHTHDVVQIEVFTPTGRFHERGIGGLTGRVVKFSLGADREGTLTLSEDGRWLRGYYDDRPSEPLELEWRSP
jgi:hypothetical protein